MSKKLMAELFETIYKKTELYKIEQLLQDMSSEVKKQTEIKNRMANTLADIDKLMDEYNY